MFTGNRTESQSGWTCFAIIVAILGILTVCSVAFGTKESSSTLRANAEENGGPLAAFKALAQNDQLLWVALSYLLYAIANVATTGVLMYLFKYILNNSNAYSIVGVIPVITGLIMAPAYPVLNKRIPRRYLYLGGMALMIIGCNRKLSRTGGIGPNSRTQAVAIALCSMQGMAASEVVPRWRTCGNRA